ncbi:MAG: ABC transporter permease [Bacteroidales bacterium]|nr:ABC transporter permease [Bacteroidales bacterium]
MIIIIGLVPGIVCSFFIYSWILDELSYNMHHKNFDNIYRVVEEMNVQNNLMKGIRTPYPVGKALNEDFEEITHNTSFRTDKFTVSCGDVVYNESEFASVDPDFFNIFSFPFITGDPKTALLNPYTVVLTERIASKYFKNENPVGKTLRINHRFDFLVTGIVENPPDNSDIQFDFAANKPFNEGPGPGTTKPWEACMHEIYILTHENTNINDLGNKIENFISKYDPKTRYTLSLDHVSNIHLYRISGDNEPIVYVYIFLITGILVLLISSINYANIFIANMLNGIPDIITKRIFGAKRNNLINQILIESSIYILVAIVLSAIFIELLRPYFNSLVHKNLEFNYGNMSFVAFFVTVFFLVQIFAGLYPALLFSSKRVEKFNQKNTLSKFSGRSKKSLVIIQYVISIALIISTIFISKQLEYIQNKELGFCKDNIIYFRTNRVIKKHLSAFKQDAIKIDGISSVSICRNLPYLINNAAGFLEWEGRDPLNEVQFSFSQIDCDYLNTFEIPLIEGRNFNPDLITDNQDFILNEEAVKRMGINNPIGLKFKMWENEGIVIGVVKNFYSNHFDYEIPPLVLSQHLGGVNYLAVKVQSGQYENTIKRLELIWEKYAPDYPFEYKFMDDSFNKLYRKEAQLVKLFFFFSAITIFISCLGLFGISSIVINQRIKEIGIRKALGASNNSILRMLFIKFIAWIAIAYLIACPIAYWFINNWLNQYEYRTSISLWPFLLAGVISILLTFISIAIFAIGAARKNPVESLRYE